MEIERAIADILAEAEGKLNKLVADALLQRDHILVQRLSRIAQRIVNAATDLQFAESPSSGRPTETGKDMDLPAATKREAESLRPAAPMSNKLVQPHTSSLASASVEPKPYPRFYRDGRELIKIGYSKTDRRTYEHRSPIEVLDRLAVLVEELGASGRKFTTERILPPHENRLSEVPSYQLYLCLGFLIRHGLVRRHGRSGYTIANDGAADLPAAHAQHGKPWKFVERNAYPWGAVKSDQIMDIQTSDDGSFKPISPARSCS